MATDITTLLIQMVTGAASPSQANALTTTSAIQNNFANDLSTIANYAQIFGTTVPGAVSIAQAVIAGAGETAVQLLGTTTQQIAQLQAYLAGEAASATATAGVTAGVVIFLTVVITLLTILGTSGESAQDQEFQAIENIFKLLDEIVGPTLGSYWNEKLTTGSLAAAWAPVRGYLDDLASETTSGPDVKNKVLDYHQAAQNFVIELVSNPFGSSGYWSVPAQPAGDVPQSSDPPASWGAAQWQYESWYGQFPTREAAAGAPGAPLADPVTMLPVLGLGIQSYMLIESLLYIIDPTTQLPFPQFLNDFRNSELQGYLDFLYGNYQSAVKGIVKTDLPSNDEILGTLWWMTQVAGVFAHPSTNPTQPTSQSWGAPWPFPSTNPGSAFSGNGLAWNLVYGASVTYPMYGYYGNAQLNGKNLFTSSYLVAQPDTTDAISQWQEAKILFNVGSDTTYISMESLENWVIPWLQNRLILGRMARWKAIYLLNGFAGVWSVLQAFQRIAGLTDVPTTMMLPQDNTIASGDWSSRELCTILKVEGKLLDGVSIDNPTDGFLINNWAPGISGYSVFALVQFLDNIGSGNWSGPPVYSTSGNGPKRPLSFRDRLAAAAG